MEEFVGFALLASLPFVFCFAVMSAIMAGPTTNNPAEAAYLDAHERSIELLKSWLSPVQLQQYNEHRYFEVIGSDTKTRYWIRCSAGAYNVAQVREGAGSCAVVVCLCFVPSFGFGGPLAPLGDALLAQKIMLEDNESEALRVANRTDSSSFFVTFSHIPGYHLTEP